ncbi:unnamed protein product [Caenorhabditis bovis]|uniref:Uncharacterized protein n=1 Tax=Caenorhabditis bovis TaxID=2654633 RepID=A0A8S1F043_9PELO|nr:unnamed protein product [Caenorhabditis bovis]
MSTNETAYCVEVLAATVFYVPYQLYYLTCTIFSIISLFLIVYFLRVYIWKSTFHPSFKILTAIYFLATFCHSLCFIAGSVMLLERILSYAEPCDITFRRIPYTLVHYPLACSLAVGLLTQTILVFERLVATIKHENYEHFYSRFYLFLFLILTVVFPCFAIIWIYRHGDFGQPVISILSPPANVENGLGRGFILAFFISFAALAILIYLQIANRRLERRLDFSLSGKFQIHENVRTTSFITRILILNMIITILYSGGVFALRNYRFEALENNKPFGHFLRNLFYLHPLNAVVVPTMSIMHVARMKRKRVKTSTDHIRMPSKGKEAAEAYLKMLRDQWSQ